MKHFLDSILAEKERLKKKLLNAKSMCLTERQKKEFEEAVECHTCKQPLNQKDFRRDHCHISGAYREAAHNKCNLNFKLSKNIPIVFHNLKIYDAHHIIT